MLKPIVVILALIAVAAFQIPGVNAGCSACKEGTDEDWSLSASSFLEGKPQVASDSPAKFSAKGARQSYEALKSNDTDEADSDMPISKAIDPDSADPDAANPDTAVDAEGNADGSAVSPHRSESFSRALVPVSADLNADVILDISPTATEYIPGAININYENFLGADKRLKPVSEIAQILGDAGISQDDSVIIYGECQPCGGGPSAATYVYWIMKYLGHEKVRLLDGGIDDWVAAKNPTETQPSVLPPKIFMPAIKPELLATYEFVKNGENQILDARTSDQLASGTIPGAVNMPYEDVLDGKRIKGEEDLAGLFAGLDKDVPVIIYTQTGVKATMPWFALTLMGYDARIYSWQDWLANSPKLGISLKEAKADPNPAKVGDVVKITAVFQEKALEAEPDLDLELSGEKAVNETEEAAEEVKDNSSDETNNLSNETNNSSNETILTIKGCATCGFGSPQGFADISSDTGIVQIGSKGKASASTSENGFKCTAKITGPSGADAGKVIMKRISGDEFSGIWNANVAAGDYDVTIIASAGDITETFSNVLEIEVTGSSKYKNLG